MFESLAEAHRVIEERFAADEMQMILEQLQPVIFFQPHADDRTGGSRVGGVPDLPRGMDWPSRPVPDNLDEIAARGGPHHSAELQQHLASGLSYTFVGQIDLAEAAALGDAASALPAEGRLLFFYDMIAGPFDTGTESTRVVWDRSSAERVLAASLPKDLTDATAAYRQAIDGINQQHGLEPQLLAPSDLVPGTPYGAPPQPIILKAMLQLPAFATPEFRASGQLERVYSADQAVIGGEQAFSQAFDDLSGLYDRHHQLLGFPVPEQDDPRYDAVVASEYNVQHLSAERWADDKYAISQSATGWELLLQLEIAAWMQQSTEGTVYFLIRKDDLRDRAFDRVVAVYQQT